MRLSELIANPAGTHDVVGLPSKTFLERWLNPIAGALAVALLGQMLASIWWVRGESDRISFVENQLAAMKADHERMELKLNAADAVVAQRLEVLDRGGTRAMEAVTRETARLTANIEKNNDRLGMLESKNIQNQVDIKRLDDQQTRIIQALDNIYNQLTEFIRQYSHNPITPGPAPTGKPRGELEKPSDGIYGRSD